ncbi:DUF4179 domain-containing protein [Paenibacillus sp. FSL W8-0426]|uniref:DUF4179 domain-containing protein n=1 Tax=Paenibacillus sp. FSL W8-0426 TaxID=2921714 RepID=UPI0030DB74C3
MLDSVETKVKNHMNHANHVNYPDFDQMFASIQKDQLRMGIEGVDSRNRSKTRTAIVLGLSAAMLATPVYAAFQYDWSSILSSKSGIESALKAGYGQVIEQSVTNHGVTLTVHTAFTDENRTVLLYTLKPEAHMNGQEIRYDEIVLKDANGTPLGGRYYQEWNAEQGVYQGYYETEQVMDKPQSQLQFSITNVRYLQDVQQSIALDPADSGTQRFDIQKDGILSVEVQSFKHAEGETRIQSSVIFAQPELKAQTWARIMAYDKDQSLIKETESPGYGTDGPTGEYFSRQIFDEQKWQQQGNRFTFAYTHEQARTEGTWSLDLSLSGQQMETGAFKKALNLPLFDHPSKVDINELVVTPTQIRVTLNHDEEYFRLPYRTYQLEVGGKIMDGYVNVEGTPDPHQTELRFEQNDSILMDMDELVNKPMTLIAKERVDEHAGSGVPIRLQNISEQPRTVTMDYEGFSVKWTYYSKDGNLYVDSESTDDTFGGINQTYFLSGGDKQYSTPQFYNDAENKHTDVFKNVHAAELDLYVHNYTTRQKQDELRIPLTTTK